MEGNTKSYIIQMSSNILPFLDLVRRVQESGECKEIMTAQRSKYNLQPYKVENLDCQEIITLYNTIEHKYKVTKELQLDYRCWNDQERKIFVWYIIFHTYWMEQPELTESDWITFSPMFYDKDPEFLRFQYFNLLRRNTKVHWTEEQDQLLLKGIQLQGHAKWNEAAKYMFFTTKGRLFKSPKHCRERWLNHLDTKKMRGDWKLQEDIAIVNYVAQQGKHWSKMVPVLNGIRTEHMIKNRFNSIVSRFKGNCKEKEDVILPKIIKILKKQISIAEIRRKKQENMVKQNTDEKSEEQSYVKEQNSLPQPAPEQQAKIPEKQEERVKIQEIQQPLIKKEEPIVLNHYDCKYPFLEQNIGNFPPMMTPFNFPPPNTFYPPPEGSYWF